MLADAAHASGLMRQRITYLLPRGSGVDPQHIGVGAHEVRYAGAHQAARETRITLDLAELAEEAQATLGHFRRLHMRVASARNHAAVEPTLSRLPAGLHVFFTPSHRAAREPPLCALLRRIGSRALPSCAAASEASGTYHFFHGPRRLPEIRHDVAAHLCAGVRVAGPAVARACASGVSVDYDYDARTRTLTITALAAPAHPPPDAQPGPGPAPAHRSPPGGHGRVEVGILAPEEADEPGELKLGGYLTVVGDDHKPRATLFAFPARHHPLPADAHTQYAASLPSPTGLHPKLDIAFPTRPRPPPPHATCALHAYLSIPSCLFIDRYQLHDARVLESHHLVALRAISGEQDLEAPDWLLTQWGSAALVELAPARVASSSEWTATIPMHLRYINGSAVADSPGTVDVSWPVVFWACEAEEGVNMGTNPFDRLNLGYDALFAPNTVFYHVPPSPSAHVLAEQLSVPFLHAESARWVPRATSIVVLLGFAWICVKLFVPPRQRTSPARKNEKKGQ